MLVEVIQPRAAGMKLTPEELAEARGNLTMYRGFACRQCGDDSAREHVLTYRRVGRHSGPASDP